MIWQQLLESQRRAWDENAPISIEELLSERAEEATPGDSDGVLDLIYQEIVLREQAGESPRLEDYIDRFPLLTDELKVMFELENALDGGSPAAPDVTVEQGISSEPETQLHNGPNYQDDTAGDNESPPDTVASDHHTLPEDSHAGSPKTPTTDHFGSYELLSKVASGGMGVVWKARQKKANRIVALKMILAGNLASTEDIQRFYSEAEAAASLDHPNIVPIYDVGEHDGQHFFSMAFIEGQSLADRVRNEPLEPVEAAGLIQAVATAIAYAHRQGIVHRDLKPANILVDGDGQVKITDFGLAKNNQDDSGLTATGQILGTPGFMSPEQARGDSENVDALSDVYSVGATLYQLVTGRPPFAAASIVDTLNQVLHQEPLPPTQLNPSIDRDLETICLKCLQKEPAKRYDEMELVADDLQHWLNGEPIIARPVGRVERAWRWCKRNAVVALSAAVVVLVLAASTTVSYLKFLDAKLQKSIAQNRQTEAEVQSKIARERRKEAEQQTEIAQATSGFLSGLFDEADPIARTGRSFGRRGQREGELTALEVINRGVKKLKTELKDKPRIRASLLDKLGNVLLSLERSDEAEPLLREALQLRLDLFGPNHLEVAASQQSVGLLHMSRAEFDQAGLLLEQALGARRQHLDKDDPLVADTLFHLGTQRAVLYEFEEAEDTLKECLAIRQRCYENESREVFAAMFLLGQMYVAKQDVLTAASYLTRAADIADSLDGKDEFSSILRLFMQAQLSASLGDLAGARSLFEDAIAKGAKLLGDDHHIVAFSRYQYAEFLHSAKEFEDAAKLLRQVEEVFSELFGENSVYRSNVLLQLARNQREAGNKQEAVAAGRESVKTHRAFLAERSARHGSATESSRGLSRHKLELTEKMHVFAHLVRDQDPDEADSLLREGLAIRLRQIGDRSVRTEWMSAQLAGVLLGRYDVKPEPTGDAVRDLKLARDWSIAAEKVTGDGQTPTEDEVLIQEHFCKQALLFLGSAVRHGVREVDALRDDAAFEILRDRDDFQTVLRELQAGELPTPAKHPPADQPSSEAPSFGPGVLLEPDAATSANVSVGDLDGDGDPDIVLAKGRHWRLANRVLLNDGKAGFAVAKDLGDAPDQSYAALLSDVDSDGDLDVVTGNASGDANMVYSNDGKAGFQPAEAWGDAEWTTRNAAVADLNADGWPDIIVANRKSTSFVCLNDGKGKFPKENRTPLPTKSTTSIIPADFNGDGFIDLAAPHRDGGRNAIFLNNGKAQFTETKEFGPEQSRSRSAAKGDLNGDGRSDLVVGDQELSVIIYINDDQGGLVGLPIGEKQLVPYSIATGDMDGDGDLDIVAGYAKAPGSIFFNDGSGTKFSHRRFGDGKGVVYGVALGDLDQDGRLDIVAARSGAANVFYLQIDK